MREFLKQNYSTLVTLIISFTVIAVVSYMSSVAQAKVLIDELYITEIEPYMEFTSEQALKFFILSVVIYALYKLLLVRGYFTLSFAVFLSSIILFFVALYIQLSDYYFLNPFNIFTFLVYGLLPVTIIYVLSFIKITPKKSRLNTTNI